ncbi:MAG: type II toxin-antitoxin system HicB family antitoxin [Anaerolineae bacterium]
MRNERVVYISLVVEPNDDGYLARCPGIQGAFAEGDNIEEAIFQLYRCSQNDTCLSRKAWRAFGYR